MRLAECSETRTETKEKVLIDLWESLTWRRKSPYLPIHKKKLHRTAIGANISLNRVRYERAPVTMEN